MSKLETQIGEAVNDIISQNAELGKELQDFYLSSAREFNLNKDGSKRKNVVVIYVPFACVSVLQKVHRKLVVELERKLK